mgnify:CR=1 FL=1
MVTQCFKERMFPSEIYLVDPFKLDGLSNFFNQLRKIVQFVWLLFLGSLFDQWNHFS